jgi:hypothetical protein
VNLGKLHSVSAPRRAWTRQFSAMGVAVAVGVFGLAGFRPTERRADAASTAHVELPVPPPLAVPPLETTTTTAPVETTTTTTTEAPPVETTTTTIVPPPPAPPVTAPPQPSPPPAPRTASSGPAAQIQVEGIADSTGWNWRTAGVRFAMGFYPGDCCHWGVYEAAKSIIWVGPTAFADPNRLRYVVLHELAHAWQYRQDRFAEIIADYSAWGFRTIGPALEAGADCLANVWGAAGSHYWRCTGEAKALTSRRLGGDWR